MYRDSVEANGIRFYFDVREDGKVLFCGSLFSSKKKFINWFDTSFNRHFAALLKHYSSKCLESLDIWTGPDADGFLSLNWYGIQMASYRKNLDGTYLAYLLNGKIVVNKYELNVKHEISKELLKLSNSFVILDNMSDAESPHRANSNTFMAMSAAV